MRQSIIRGIGVVSPLGIGKEKFWDFINGCNQAYEKIFNSKYPELNGAYCIRIDNFNSDKYLSPEEQHNLDLNSTFVTVAAKLAINDASLNLERFKSSDIGVTLGTTSSIATSMSDFDESVILSGPRRCSIGIFPNAVHCAPASRISIFEHITGSNTTLSSGRNSGLDAIGYSYLSLRSNRVKIMISGGGDALSDKIAVGLNRYGYLFRNELNNEEMINRKGRFVPSEGAYIIVLDNGHCVSKDFYAKIISYNCNFSVHKKTDVLGRSKMLLKNLKQNVKDAEISVSKIDGVILSSYFDQNDLKVELMAVEQLLKSHVINVPILCPKKIVGECFASTGPMSVIIGLGVFNHRIESKAIEYLNVNDKLHKIPELFRNILVINVDSSGHLGSLLIRSY